MIPVLELEKALHASDRAATAISNIKSKLVNVAGYSSASPLYPPSLLIRVIDHFGRTKVYLREYCAWNLSGHSAGQGIARIRKT